MAQTVPCVFEGCKKESTYAHGLCRRHRAMQLRGEPLRPLAHRQYANRGKECRFDGCTEEAYSWGLCKGHNSQHRRGDDLYPLHDRERTRRRKREEWASLTSEQRALRLEPMIAAIRGHERSEEHCRRLSESLRARYASGQSMVIAPRVCRGCSIEFTPTGGRQWWCTKECRDRLKRLKRHGLSYEQYAEMLERQGNVCALCGRAEGGWGHTHPLMIDHCHTTGVVRGLLCGECNTALGRFGDDPARLRQAAAYLEEVL